MAKAAKSCNKKPTLNRQNPINFSSSTSYFSNLFEPGLTFPILAVNSPWKMPPEVFKALQTLGPTHGPLPSHLWCFPPFPGGPSTPIRPSSPSSSPQGFMCSCASMLVSSPEIPFHFLLSHPGCLLFVLWCLAQAPPPPGGPPCPSLPTCIHSTQAVVLSLFTSSLCLSWGPA